MLKKSGEMPLKELTTAQCGATKEEEMLKLVVHNTVQDLAYQELRLTYLSQAFKPARCSIETLLKFDLVLIDGGIIKPSMEVTWEEAQQVIMVTCFRNHQFTPGSSAELKVVS